MIAGNQARIVPDYMVADSSLAEVPHLAQNEKPPESVPSSVPAIASPSSAAISTIVPTAPAKALPTGLRRLPGASNNVP